MEPPLPICERRDVVFDKHGLAQRFFIDRLVRNCQPAPRAFRPEIFHEIGDELLALAGSKCARYQARACIIKWVLHQIDRRIPLRFIPLLVW